MSSFTWPIPQYIVVGNNFIDAYNLGPGQESDYGIYQIEIEEVTKNQVKFKKYNTTTANITRRFSVPFVDVVWCLQTGGYLFVDNSDAQEN